MKVLVVKMSSMGDVIHCLPAITDLAKAIPQVEIDWVVEEGFADIVRLHPSVSRVMPIAIRRWRKGWLASRQEISECLKAIRQRHYDVVIDAQGLMKSALVARLAKGPVSGFDRQSARESIASLVYSNSFFVNRDQHAVDRQRQLFAAHFGYEISPEISYGLELGGQVDAGQQEKSVFFLHATTWASKHWPEQYWSELATLCADHGYSIKLTYQGAEEQMRAERIASTITHVELIPPTGLQEIARIIAGCAGAVAVDTGLGHLAVACDVPLVGLYGPTSPKLTGVAGTRQISLAEPNLSCAPCLQGRCRFKPGEHSSNIHPPCFTALNPQHVFAELQKQMAISQ